MAALADGKEYRHKCGRVLAKGRQMRYREHQGDIWDLGFHVDVRCITTNGVTRNDGACVMGRGVAKQAAEKWPRLPYDLGARIEAHGNTVFYFRKYSLVTLPVKHHWRERADVELIRQSLELLVGMANVRGWRRVALIRLGCGNGQLMWKEDGVEAMCRELLDERFHIVERG